MTDEIVVDKVRSQAEISVVARKKDGLKERVIDRSNLLAPVESWELITASRNDEQELQIGGSPLAGHLKSPVFSLEKDNLYIFRFSGRLRGFARLALVLLGAEHDWFSSYWSRIKAVECDEGEVLLGFSFMPTESKDYRLILANYYGSAVDPAVLSGSKLELLQVDSTREFKESLAQEEIESDTYLPHWGFIRRAIHRACKRSRIVNSFVASLEMRWNRTEVLSLPMYMSFCPTGQCNALCDFCSVTIKRTGIIKKQLPVSRIHDYVDATKNTILMYGLEGNGEPTLFNSFNNLFGKLIQHGAHSYLITNGSNIEDWQIPHLLSFQSITFSLNAATPETHKRVMKLKHYEKIIDSIKSIVEQRGISLNPCIYVSFVVYNENVHELQDFLALAENELKADVVVVRPLSELATDLGVVEDLRDLVPYESDIRDALDSASEYLSDIERRIIPNTEPQRRCEIRIDPDAFRSVRPDPLDRIIMPRGYEDRFLAPRRGDWHTSGDIEGSVDWRLNTLLLNYKEDSPGGSILTSIPVPVEKNRLLEFRCSAVRCGASLGIKIMSTAGELVAEETLGPEEAGKQSKQITLDFDTGDNSALVLEIDKGAGELTAEIDFFRLRTPGVGIRETFKLPHRLRWTIDTPGTLVEWSETVLHIRSNARPGAYLYKCFSSPCRSNERITLPVDIKVHTGSLIIGVLTEDFQSWIDQFTYPAGVHAAKLEIDTGENKKIQFVLIRKGNEPLDAEIDWGDSLEDVPLRELKLSNKKNREGALLEQVEEETPSAPVSAVKREGFISRLFGRSRKDPKRNKYYCQKPWTDLNNFTVDGRMDVCCIATGASQEGYAYGNLFEQSFQEVWNGEVAKRFRKTVNSRNKLPPCERCPMANSAQGPFFDSSFTSQFLMEEFERMALQGGSIKRFVGRRLITVHGLFKRIKRKLSA